MKILKKKKKVCINILPDRTWQTYYVKRETDSLQTCQSWTGAAAVVVVVVAVAAVENHSGNTSVVTSDVD